MGKGADLRKFGQADLDAIASELNHRPRRMHGYRSSAQLYADLSSSDALTPPPYPDAQTLRGPTRRHARRYRPEPVSGSVSCGGAGTF